MVQVPPPRQPAWSAVYHCWWISADGVVVPSQNRYHVDSGTACQENAMVEPVTSPLGVRSVAAPGVADAVLEMERKKRTSNHARVLDIRMPPGPAHSTYFGT